MQCKLIWHQKSVIQNSHMFHQKAWKTLFNKPSGINLLWKTTFFAYFWRMVNWRACFTRTNVTIPLKTWAYDPWSSRSWIIVCKTVEFAANLAWCPIVIISSFTMTYFCCRNHWLSNSFACSFMLKWNKFKKSFPLHFKRQNCELHSRLPLFELLLMYWSSIQFWIEY